MLWDTFGEGHHLPFRELHEEAIIFDLGAYVGYTAVDYAIRYPDARIFAVEMDAANVELAARNLEPFKERCVLVQEAIWSSAGEVEYSGDEEWALSVVTANDDGLGTKPRTPATTLELLLDRFGLDHVDFVKMDIEGAEHEVIKIDAGWLNKVSELNLEIHPPATFEQCSAVLESSGFVVTRTVGRRTSSLSALRQAEQQH